MFTLKDYCNYKILSINVFIKDYLIGLKFLLKIQINEAIKS